MWPTFNILMRIISTLIGIVMILMGAIWILQGLNLAFRVGFMVGNYHWTIYGATLALVGVAQVVWSNTQQAKTWPLRDAASIPPLPSVAISAGTLMNESSRAVIVESIGRFRNAFNTGNLDEIARYYTDDMVKF